MARTSYAAPGVYVEEVPSAQQPIAGVGTNTVGFLGIVPDEIKYPVPNEDYDPVIARKATGGVGEAKEVEDEKTRLDNEIKQQQTALTEAKTSQTRLQEQLDAPGLEEAAKNRLTRDKARRDRDVERIKVKLTRKSASSGIDGPAGAVDAKFLKPYKLESFKIAVDPASTKLCTNFSEYTRSFGPFSADDDRIPEKP